MPPSKAARPSGARSKSHWFKSLELGDVITPEDPRDATWTATKLVGARRCFVCLLFGLLCFVFAVFFVFAWFVCLRRTRTNKKPQHTHHHFSTYHNNNPGTLGPACQSPELLGEMLDAGMTAARVDLTWGPVEYHRKSLAALNVREDGGRVLFRVCV